MTEKDGNNKTLIILVPVIVAFIGVIGIMIQADWFSARMTPPTPTLPPSATEAVAIIPTSEPTLTFTAEPSGTSLPPTPTATSTPIPPPLLEIFPQAENGAAFVFVNNPAVFASDFVRDNCAREGVYGLKLAYDINNSGSAGWGVQWADSATGYFDVTAYSALVFWVKGGTGDERFQVGIKDDLKREYKIESTDLIVLSEDWQLVRVPLASFRDVNLAFVNNLNFGFNLNQTKGVLCIDDISLEK